VNNHITLSLVSAWLLVGSLNGFAAGQEIMDVSASPHVKFRTIGLGDARWTSGFWADRWDATRRVTIPIMKQVMELPDNSATFHNLRVAAGEHAGKFVGNNWSDGDCYKWIEVDCFCCPPNLARTIAQLHTYAYGMSPDTVWIHLYGASQLDTQLPGGDAMQLSQTTDYPWDGKISIRIEKTPEKEMALRLRIPAWVEQPVLKVNGQVSDEALKPGSYSEIRRGWKAGDVVELELPMPGVLMESHPLVEENRNQVAVMRGPLFKRGDGVDQFNRDQTTGPGIADGQSVWEHRIIGLSSTAPGPLGKHGVVFNGGKPGTYTIYLDNLRIRHHDGSTTPLWTSGKDTRAGKFTANELFKDLKIRAVSVAEVGK